MIIFVFNISARNQLLGFTWFWISVFRLGFNEVKFRVNQSNIDVVLVDVFWLLCLCAVYLHMPPPQLSLSFRPCIIYYLCHIWDLSLGLLLYVYGQEEFECQYWLLTGEKPWITTQCPTGLQPNHSVPWNSISHPPSHVMLAPFLSFSFDVNVFVRKRLFPSLHLSGDYEKCFREPKHFIFSLFVVTVTVTHPVFYETVLLFLLLPWIT